MMNDKNQFKKNDDIADSLCYVIDNWLDSKKCCVKESTFAQYRRIVKTVLTPRLTNMKPEELDSIKLRKVIENISKAYKPSTVQSIRAVLGQIVQFMYDNRYIESIPTLRMKYSYKTKTPDILSRKEQKILTNYLMQNTDLSKLGVLLCLYTGIRIGELCGLQWQDVDVSSCVIHVRRTIQRISDGNGNTYFYIGSPKTEHSERVIPLPDFLLNMILPYQKDGKGIYVTTGTQSFIQPRTYQNRFKKYLKDCQIPDYHFHTLRHTFASRAIELGFDPKSLSEILGHSSVKITLELYVHPTIDQKRKEMNLFSDFF